jgi:hypothetical protein
MNQVIDIIGNVVGVSGILICLLAGVVRISGSFYVFGFEAVTLFIGGTSLMVAACLAKLHLLQTR